MENGVSINGELSYLSLWCGTDKLQELSKKNPSLQLTQHPFHSLDL
jgi:hypothetical protein